ncbi:putative ABC transport system ATP-binding protein [Natronospira proteinivora]|uniref:ABC transport system ATP-binding protein n=1 Tax=Natronospira proteinivora TaxID=1807133 RepID=A0ABT1G823_9GAMM|nr:ATP-binding cassette domain-containing protein [Natronospira proteinivora]MCP1727440.1 putative ABC transport system ATP-binding protein [Natronospira proteinivora]
MPENSALANPQHPAVSLLNLQCRRGGRTLFHIREWTLPRGEHGLLRGPSGSGKTTLLHAIAGLDQAEDGLLATLGEPLPRRSARFRDRFRAHHLGLIFQDFHLLEGLRVEDNLQLAAWLGGQSRKGEASRAMLERLGLAHLARCYPHTLSQGEKQRVAIGRALINEPDLILADEPTSALDDANSHNVIELLLSEAARLGASLLVATHDNRIAAGFEHELSLNEPS